VCKVSKRKFCGKFLKESKKTKTISKAVKNESKMYFHFQRKPVHKKDKQLAY